MFLWFILVVVLSSSFSGCIKIEVDPTVRNGTDIVIESHASLNLTCIGDKPLQWKYPEYSSAIDREKSSAKMINEDSEGIFRTTLFLQNAYYLNTGYFTCEEKNNSDNFERVYVYVRDEQNLLVVNDSIIALVAYQYQDILIPCRPTSPDIVVNLSKEDEPLLPNPGVGAPDIDVTYTKQVGFILKSASLKYVGSYECTAEKNGIRSSTIYELRVYLSIFIYSDDGGSTETRVLDVNFDPHVGFVIKDARLFDSGGYSCNAFQDDYEEEPFSFYFQVIVNPHTDSIHKPTIKLSSGEHVMLGQTVILDCSIQVAPGIMVTVSWSPPDPNQFNTGHMKTVAGKTKVLTHNLVKSMLESTKLYIYDVTAKDEGVYKCNVYDHSHNHNYDTYDLKIFSGNTSFLNITPGGKNESIARGGINTFQLVVNIFSHPPPTHFVWYNSMGRKIDNDNEKYIINNSNVNSKLKINALNVTDSGIYSLNVSNGVEEKSIDLKLLVEGLPSVRLMTETYYMENFEHEIKCSVIAYPNPSISWSFQSCPQYPHCEDKVYTIPDNETKTPLDFKDVNFESSVFIKSTATGVICCTACNTLGCVNETNRFLVTDVQNGFDIFGPHQLTAGDNSSLTCGASVYDYNPDIEWYLEDKHRHYEKIENRSGVTIVTSQTNYSYRSTLLLQNVTVTMTGNYVCYVKPNDSDKESISHKLVIVPEMKPRINNTTFNKTDSTDSLIVVRNKLKWHCGVSGSPAPYVKWLKNGEDIKYLPEYIESHRRDNIFRKHTPEKRIQILDGNKTLVIDNITMSDAGDYSCVAQNRVGTAFARTKLKVVSGYMEAANFSKFWFVLIAVLSIILFIVIVALFRKFKSERDLKKQLTAVGLINFEEGKIESLNPELDVGEQADLLPYNKKFEFPRNKLKLGKQLGSGAFGVVLKAEADGIIEPDVVTTVAVKMVKQNVDITHIKALASELKIMIHLGRHLNVVNLLGACTRNLNNSELLVIVEYCAHGNLHKYLQQHRNNFINQVNLKTGKFDPTIISSNSKYVNMPASNGGITINSNGTVRLSSLSEDSQQQTAQTDITYVSTPVGEDGYLICKDNMPELKNKNSESISTQDLLCWSFQIARGMEYLASRKVLHGDLAARNILLAENNIVKICDFGLSKNMYMYNNDNYFKKGNRLLPVKWMALEAIRDRNFSTQSDIWAYGIVLWELFSLARTPYPGLEDVEKLYHKLESGYRMEKPEFATRELYDLMNACWLARPMMRPSFTDIAERVGSMLEDSVTKHYVDLNDPFLQQNSEFLSQQDYLSMLSSPTYANISRSNDDGGESSRHQATNDYLLMKQRKMKDAKEETELRPMLSSLAGRGSVSDGDSLPDSPVATSSQPENFVSVTEATANHGFSNPTYHNLGRPPLNPYMNTPYVIEKEGKPYGQQWNSSQANTTE